jgi:hypothetical protein
MSDSEQRLDPIAVVQMIVALWPSTIDEAAVRSAFGTTAAKSMAEVSRAFRVSYQTAKEWRVAGMPGDSKRRSYPWAEVVLWWMARNAANSQQRQTSATHTDIERRELAEIEIQLARYDLTIRRAKAAATADDLVEAQKVRTETSMVLGLIRDDVMGIPEQLLPQLPRDAAESIAEFVESVCSRALNAAADRLDAMAENPKAYFSEWESDEYDAKVARAN